MERKILKPANFAAAAVPISATLPQPLAASSRQRKLWWSIGKAKPIHWESAITKLFTGFAFLAVSIVLAISGRGRGWWFWLLIPAFTMLGSGIAQYVQLKKSEKSSNLYPDPSNRRAIDLPSAQHTALPPTQTDYVAPESRYKTGDLVPPSVTDGTTRRLEIDKEGQTMTLPKV